MPRHLFPCVCMGLVLALVCTPGLASFRLGIDDARHLLARTSYSYSLQDVQRFADMRLTEAVEALVNVQSIKPSQDYPKFLKMRPISIRELRATDITTKKKLRKQRIDQKEALKAWWIREIQQTQSPLYERMVMFWYRFFGVGLQNLPNIYSFYRHQLILRQEALGSYRMLMHKMLKDIAFLHYYKNTKNFKINPANRLSKALIHDIVLGLPNPEMADVRALTQALSGASIDPNTGFYRYYESLHDERNKTLFGENYGDLQPDGVADALLAHPRAAEHLVEQLWRFFISPVPEKNAVETLALAFRNSNYNIKSLMRQFLSLPAFWSESHRGELMKSPVELLVGIERLFDEPVFSPETTVEMAAQLGEDIYNPSRSGKQDGTASPWLDSQSYALRQHWMRQLTAGVEPSMASGATPGSNLQLIQSAVRSGILQTYLLPVEAYEQIANISTPETFFQILNDPAFQLK